MTDPILNAWSSFYVMTGSSAAALTGLMFVVITLVYNRIRPGDVVDGIGTFSTPNVLHFCAALFFSAAMLAPWHTFVQTRIVITVAGLVGLAYGVRVAHKTIHRDHSDYKPDLEDWTWYTALPIVAYLIATVAGTILTATVAPFALGAAVMLLIFLGIHNAWDAITYLAATHREEDDDQ